MISKKDEECQHLIYDPSKQRAVFFYGGRRDRGFSGCYDVRLWKFFVSLSNMESIKVGNLKTLKKIRENLFFFLFLGSCYDSFDACDEYDNAGECVTNVCGNPLQ